MPPKIQNVFFDNYISSEPKTNVRLYVGTCFAIVFHITKKLCRFSNHFSLLTERRFITLCKLDRALRRRWIQLERVVVHIKVRMITMVAR